MKTAKKVISLPFFAAVVVVVVVAIDSRQPKQALYSASPKGIVLCFIDFFLIFDNLLD